MRSHALPLFLLFALLAALGLFGWLTHNPDSELVEQAKAWPVVGPFATRFQTLYSPISPDTPGLEGGSEPAMIQPIEVYAPPLRDYIWVEEDQAIFSAPRLGSRTLGRTRAISNLSIIETQGDWYRVWSNPLQVEGWVHLPGYYDRDPPLGMDPDPPGPLAPRKPDPAELEKALNLFKDGYQTHQVGPYTLLTDVEDPTLIRELERQASPLDSVYARRYGRTPIGNPAESLVLYSREAPYRVIQHQTGHLHGLEAAGHATQGMVLFYVGKRRRHEIRSTLAHEVGHLINRRALGPALPPWLDEGIADDLANGKMTADGLYRPEELSGLSLDWGDHHTFEGGWASLLNLERAINNGKMPSLQELLSHDWQTFMGHESRLNYDASSFWIRFLLDDPDGPMADALKSFFDDVAEGRAIDPENLRRKLDQPWSSLDTAFRAWVVAKARKLRANPP